MIGHVNAPHNAQATFKPASDKQIAFLESLRASRTPDVDADAVREWAQQVGSKAVSAKIDELKAMPKVAVVKAGHQHADEPEDGIYYVPNAEGAPGDIFKVYKMVHGSGRQGCKKLVLEDDKGSFHYLGSAAKRLPKAARKMTLDEAKKFGAIYGFCVRCGATLTDDDSIAAGIGPVCAGKWA